MMHDDRRGKLFLLQGQNIRRWLASRVPLRPRDTPERPFEIVSLREWTRCLSLSPFSLLSQTDCDVSAFAGLVSFPFKVRQKTAAPVRNTTANLESVGRGDAESRFCEDDVDTKERLGPRGMSTLRL
jgi:hypothetical protein